MTNVALKAVNQYQSADNSSIAYADPHELILRLMNGAMERIAQAKGAIKHQQTGQKGEHSQQGDLSGNLSDLYQYMIIALTEANMSDDIARLNEISDLLLTIKSAWEQIPGSTK
jgi:flagellar protein FliS